MSASLDPANHIISVITQGDSGHSPLHLSDFLIGGHVSVPYVITSNIKNFCLEALVIMLVTTYILKYFGGGNNGSKQTNYLYRMESSKLAL